MLESNLEIENETVYLSSYLRKYHVFITNNSFDINISR